MVTKKKIIEDAFGKGVTENTIKTQLGLSLKESNRLIKDIDETVDQYMKSGFFDPGNKKYANRIKRLKEYMDQASEEKKVGTGLKEGKGTDFGMLSVKAGIDKNPKPTKADRIAGAKMNAKSGARTTMRGTGAALRGYRKAKLS